MPLKDLLTTSLPEYCHDLISGKNVCFRPMVVAEEKALLLAIQTQDKQTILKTLTNIISSCFGGNKDWLLSDFEHMFLLLRAKSIGETEGFIVKCPTTNEEVSIKIDLSKNTRLSKNKSNNKIKINDNLVIVFKEPSLKCLFKYPNYKSSTQELYGFIATCIKQIQNQKEIIDCSELPEKEVVEFIQNLTSSQFKSVIEYFDELPKVEVFGEYTTTDGVKREIQIRGIFDFISFFLNI